MAGIQTSAPDVIRYSAVVFSSLSLLGATYIFLSTVLHKRLRSFSFRMILWLCIFDFVLGCSTICGPLGTIEEEAGISNENGVNVLHSNIKIGNEYEASLPLTCKLQAAAIQFSIIASLLWTLCFAIHLFRISTVNVNPQRTHSYTSFLLYLLLTIPIPAFLTYYIFAAGLVGITQDFWCWIKDEYLDEWAWKMLYIYVGILVLVLFVLYFALKFHLKRFIDKSKNVHLLLNRNHENNADFPNQHHRHHNLDLILNRSRFSFVRTISGGLSSYLFAPFIAFIPAHFNLICTMVGLEWNEHVLSWYILSSILLGALHFCIFLCGISIVRHSWSTCCDQPQDAGNVAQDNNQSVNANANERDSKKEFIKRSIRQSNQHYMELVWLMFCLHGMLMFTYCHCITVQIGMIRGHFQCFYVLSFVCLFVLYICYTFASSLIYKYYGICDCYICLCL